MALRPNSLIKRKLNIDLKQFKKAFYSRKNSFKPASIEPYPENVCIIGAGAAGLYTGLLLDSMKIKYTILEKLGRVGGRMDTYYFGGDKNLWADLGCMRIPIAKYQQRLLELIKYLNSNLPPEKKDLRLEPLHFDMESQYLYVNGIKMKYDDALSDVSKLGFGFPQGYDPVGLYNEAIDGILDLMESNKIEELLKYDTISFRSYMLDFLIQKKNINNGLAQSTVNFLELIFSGTNEYDLSTIEQILDEFDFAPTAWDTIKHGLNKIAVAFTGLNSNFGKSFNDNIQYNCEVTKIRILNDKKLEVFFKNSSEGYGYEKSAIFDRVVITAPFDAVRFWELPEFSLLKRTAIRTLHYGEAAKVFTLHKERFWEKDGIKGGVTVSDLTSRVTVYDGYKPPENPTYGVLLSSYTWDQDAVRFIQFNADQAANHVLTDLVKIHGNEEPLKSYTHQNVLKIWESGYALFEPGQFSNFYPEAFFPEHRIHFAGEHTSIFHAWIIGALNSAYRVVQEIFLTTAPEKLPEFYKIWPKYEYDE